MFRRKLRIAFIAVSLFVGAPLGRGADEGEEKDSLKAAVKSLASAVKKSLEEEKQDSVAVGDFTGPRLDSNFGPGLKKLLTDELRALKVTVSAAASHSLVGTFAPIEDPLLKRQIAIRLTVFVMNAAAEQRSVIKADVRSNADIAKVTGVTTSLPPRGDKEVRNQKIQQAVKNPQVQIEGSLIKTKPDSPFAVEVLVKSQPRLPRAENGKAFVDIKRDEVYEVRVHNNSKLEAAVTLEIDGLDVFSFSDVRDPKTNKPLYKHFLVGPGKTLTVPGWHKTNKRALEFLVTDYGKGAGSGAGKSIGEVGVLTVTFSLAGTHPQDLPNEDGGTHSTDALETGFGAARDTDFQEKTRFVGVVRDIVSVRYVR